MPTSCMVTGSRSLASVLSDSFSLVIHLLQPYVQPLLPWYHLHCNFLCLGGELKTKAVGTVFGLSVRIDGPNPSRTDET